MIIRDFAEEVFHAGGELRGGVINFLGSPPRVCDDRRYFARVLAFSVDDNHDSDDFTALCVATKQRDKELGDIITHGGLMSIDVHHITPTLFKWEDTDLRLVYGKLHLHVKGGDGDAMTNSGLVMFHPPTNAMVTTSYDVKGRPVHVHMMCLDDEGRSASHEEKLRRIAALSQEAKMERIVDGYRRLRW